MSRAMGSSRVFTCWGAASWHGGRVMLVLGASAAAGAGLRAGVRGSAPFGVVVVCGCSLVTVLAGGVAPVCGSGCGRWWALSWREVCGVSRGGAGGVGCGVGVVRLRSCVGGLWCPMSPAGGGGCGVVWWCCVVWWPSRWGGGGGTVSRSGGVGCRPWFVLSRCGAAPRSLLIVLLACFSTWAVRGRCGVGPGAPWGGLCGTGVSQPGGCGRVMLGGVGPPLSGPSGAGSAVYGPCANYGVCGVRGSVGRGILGVLWPRCGARGW